MFSLWDFGESQLWPLARFHLPGVNMADGEEEEEEEDEDEEDEEDEEEEEALHSGFK